MPIYEIRSYDVWGNAAEGFEINDTRRAGEVYLAPSGELGIHDYFEFPLQVFLDARRITIYDPYTSEEVVIDGRELSEMKVSLDGFMEQN